MRQLLIVLGLGLASCQLGPQTSKNAATIVGRGVVNTPSNKSLRFDMIKFGLGEFCRQLLQEGTPLRLADGQPVMGRYFGETCQAKSIDNLEKKSIIVQFGGRGYAWTAATGRLGFRARGLLELAPDFRVYEDAMYVYFRPIQVDTSDFELLMTEQVIARAAAQIAGLNEEELGRAIISAQLSRGFTAIRYDADGHTDFALGLVNLGAVPFRHFRVLSSPRSTVANGRTELFVGQNDFLGRISIKKSQAIRITLQVAGTPQVDFALLEASSARPVLDRYLTKPGNAPLPVVPTFAAVATNEQLTRAEVRVPEGEYFLVLDHSRAWGDADPAPTALPARIDYLVQIGSTERP